MNTRWQELLQFCLGRFQVMPGEFWKMSLPELQALYELAENNSSGAPLDRQAFDELLNTYPDSPSDLNTPKTRFADEN